MQHDTRVPRRPLDQWTTVFQWIPHSLVYGVTTDNYGNVYYTTETQLWKINLKNSPKPECIFVVEPEDGQLRHLVWGRKNALYICSENYHQILKFNTTTKELLKYAGTGAEGCTDGRLRTATFSHPDSINIDPAGNLFITCLHDIRKIDTRIGYVTTIATLETFPRDLAISDDGTLYGADCNHYCFQVKNGKVVVLAGSINSRGYQDGPLQSSRFIAPRSITMDEDGTILMADLNGVRRIDFNNNQVTTLKECNEVIPGRSIINLDNEGNLIAGYIDLLILMPVWKIERCLWIGKLKEDRGDCVLASLPKELVREIIWNFRRTCRRKHAKRDFGGNTYYVEDNDHLSDVSSGQISISNSTEKRPKTH